MNTSDLLQLLPVRHLTAAELRTRHPELWARLETDLQQAAGPDALDAGNQQAPRVPKPGVDGDEARSDALTRHLRQAARRPGETPVLPIDVIGGRGSAAPLRDDVPIKNDARVNRLLRRAHLIQIASIGKLDPKIVESIGDVGRPDSLTDPVLATLVGAGKVTEAQAAALGSAASMYALSDEDADLARAFATAAGASAGGPEWTRTLAAFGPSDWLDLVRRQRVPIPADTTEQEFASALAERFATLHPDAALLGRLPKIDPAVVAQRAGDLHAIFQRNPSALEHDFGDLDLSGLTAGQLERAQTAHDALRRVARAYPGLGLAEALADEKSTPAARAATVLRRTGFIDKLRARAGDGQLLYMDFSPGSPDLDRLGLGALGAEPAEQKLVVKTLKAYQRIFALTGRVDEAQALIESGYSSAVAVAKQPLDQFLAKSSHDRAEARWRDARATLLDTTLTAGAIIDAVAGMFDDLHVGNVQPAAPDYLRTLDGFEALFGSLAFCTCRHCQSILGPAAYFVDLMHFVHEHIDPQFDGHSHHPLHLKERRPDLWTLELTCENTNQRVPTLDIVNEILENYVAKQKGFAGSLTDRAAIADLVYRQTLLGTVNSFAQPFHLPLARVDQCLAMVESRRGDIARAVGVDADLVAAAELSLSPEQWHLVTHREVSTPTLNGLYQLTFTSQGTGFAPVDAQDLVAAMGIDRDELDRLIAGSFVRAGGAAITVKAEKRSADSVQNDIEKVHGLTADGLDRMHRFVRLWRRTPWSIAELDRLLTATGETILDGPGVCRVAAARVVQQRLGTSIDETAALIGAIPRTPDAKSLFDRLFNPAGVAPADRLPRDAARFVHPAFRADTAVPADPVLPRLLAGLGVDLLALATLARRLAAHLATESGTLDVDAANEDDRYFVLSAANLSLLYRHARLARALRVTIDDLFQLIGIAGIAGGRVTSAADVLAVIEADRWRRESGYTLDDVAVVTGGTPRDATPYLDPAATAAAIVAGAADAFSFGDTIFSVALGTSEQASRDIVATNPGLFETAADGRRRLVAGVDLATAVIAVPASATMPVPPAGARAVTADDVRGVMSAYEPSAVLGRALAAAFGFDATKMMALARLSGADLTANALTLAVRGETGIDPLRDLVGILRPLAVAFKAKEWDATAIEFVQSHPDRFAIAPPVATVAALEALSVYGRLAKRTAGVVEAADIRDALAAFDAATRTFATTAHQPLGRIIGVSPGLVAALRGRVVLPAAAAPALDALDRAARLADTLGTDGESFVGLAGVNYAALGRGADALVAAFGARFAEDAERQRQLDLLARPVREQQRDALVAWLVHSLAPRRFKRPDDLYEYFLVDAEAGGCSTTSRVVAATSSVQLYVHRIIMNLEQTPADASDPLSLRMPESAAAEWTWRRNYRVWEANRKVFLWPENYIEPDLRDDKTALFKELEDELLQTSISDQDVLDSYTKYLRGFEEVASLTIAGAYHDVYKVGRDTADVLHLFGVASTDPPVFYYRTCENLIGGGRQMNRTPVWTPWQKVDLQITSRRVAPVVYRGRLHVFWADYKTRPFNIVSGGKSDFAGYRHTMTVRFSTLRPDGNWTPPQAAELPADWPFSAARGVIQDPLDANHIPRLDVRPHSEPIDDYTLRGTSWDALYPDPHDPATGPFLSIAGRNYQLYGWVDLFHREIPYAYTLRDSPGDELGFPVLCSRDQHLYYGHPVYWYSNRNAYGDMVLAAERIKLFNVEYLTEPLNEGLYIEQIAGIDQINNLVSVSGSIEDAILQSNADVLLVQGSAPDDDRFLLYRIGTTLAEHVAYCLSIGGVDGLLDITTQYALKEAGIPLTIQNNRIEDRSNTGTLDFKGPYGVYYREIFFHIPFLIANALNARGNFAAAQRWYHYIFDPTATEVIQVPPGTPAEERARRLLDRVWRYREFRNLDPARLRDILTDEVALAVYRKDPFNPHAIARLRLSAYQKSIVMKYVDNLLDWADFLFTQFTMESVNEASMLYAMAADVLGPRPARLGDCGEGAVRPKTYGNIQGAIGKGEEILIEIESWLNGGRAKKVAKRSKARFALDQSRVSRARASAPLSRTKAATAMAPAAIAASAPAMVATPVARAALDAVTRVDAAEAPPLFNGLSWKETRTAAWTPALSAATTARAGAKMSRTVDHRGRYHISDWVGSFGWGIIRQVSPVFCIPVNTDLLAYWDRVEDRLYKIRHCQDITGQARELALFAPPIDPRLLVRMRALGLTLEDVLGNISGDLPPYRFPYLIERAKAFAGTLSTFGGALLTALEKKDGEELNRLRAVHEQNLARMTTQLKRWDIRSAEESLAMAQRQQEAAVYRRDYYDGLVNEYRSGLEFAESVLRHVVAGIHGGEALLDLMAAIFAAYPQVGSPFAMKYGGVELNTTLRRFGNAAAAVAQGLEAAASSVGLEATYDRRAEGWRHQKELASYDVRQMDRQVAAAQIRVDIANRALEIHERTIEQMDEMVDLIDTKFTNLGLYTWLSAQLRRLHRDAYQNALALARLAEQAFRFERGDETWTGLAANYWDASHAGLLAGEQLLGDLQGLERRYLETNYRSLEMEQAFALSQIAPDALVQLRETGECHFTVQELFFDLFYPGHYKRRIKAVRLTVPCVTGPYVNVSATLTLDRSWIRTTPAPGNALTEVPPRRSVSVATSTAHSDAGVFELSFHDERYMPFEGTGAISQWVLSLPKTFRQFDYQTINDVIVTISYTAEQDGGLRDRVEANNAALEGALRKALAETPIARLFSLRQEFPSEFARLLSSPAGTEVRIDITERHFPIFIGNRSIAVTRSALLLRRADGVNAGGFQVSVDGTAVTGFVPDPTLGNLAARPLPGAFAGALRGSHVLKVDAAGDFAPVAPSPGNVGAIDSGRLLDVLLYAEYTVVP